MIEPRRATIPVTLDLPWEIAELVVLHGPALIAALEYAVRERHAVVVQDAEAKARTEEACEAQLVEWDRLADRAIREISRRMNGQGQRKSVLKQLAAEWGMSAVDLDRIIRVHRRRRVLPKREKK
jgi:hypothetical protein